MKRRLLNLLTLLSLLLFVAVAALWVRSCFAGEELKWERHLGRVESRTDEVGSLQCEAGRIGLNYMKLVYSGPAVSVSPDDDGRIDFSHTTTRRPVRLGVAIPGGGLGYRSWNQPTRSLRPPNTMSGQGWSLVVPLYFPAALSACLPAGRLVSWWWRGRIRRGFNLLSPSHPEQGTGTGSGAPRPTPSPAAPAAPASKP